ncbi:DUF1543 domain-containing protein [Bradyrhizobium sp. LTSPM299]|uniref:DUF1543 domain-containing protein n=1 Tax=Bradyrhizobium sp. LTSPM299 TaxID=1619233 RepID=UPI000AAE1322|nr:DUF1543 domain-containing protein [Bradyrhizobium sp. LTSPM299]
MKLFMFYIGGDCQNSNVELHDVRFSVGQSIEDCYDDLRAQWWGDPKSLHLDCWGEINQADGYDVSLTREPAAAAGRLFFVNLGGYDPKQFSELHRNVLLVASDAPAAKARALTLIEGWNLPHKDRLFEIEKAVDISAAMERRGYSLRLSKAALRQAVRVLVWLRADRLIAGHVAVSISGCHESRLSAKSDIRGGACPNEPLRLPTLRRVAATDQRLA